MSGGSSTNNSWTILTPEETVAETLKPLEEGTEHHEESLPSAAGGNQPANGEESVEEPPVEGQPVPEEQTAQLSGDASTEKHAQVPAAVTESPVPTSLEVSSSSVPDSDTLSQSEDLLEGPAQTSPDPDSFSDSYTHITPSPEEPPVYLLSTETLGGVESTQEEERLTQEATVYLLNGEGLQLEGEESRTPDIGKQAVYLVDQLVLELFSIWARRLSGEAVVEVAEESTEKTGAEGEPEVRRRRSLLAAIERIGQREEEDEGVEEFQLPPRDDDSGFSVNKCILGAVILLGLGTIFISGVLMDLDEDSDYATRELKDAELPGKQEWLNPEVPSSPVDADSTELLNKLAKENEQISVLQAQLQAQKEELKVVKGAVAEGVKEHLRWEEVEKENSRLKKEIASLPVLQKDNERMKRELESVVALHKELEMLRSTVTELKLSPAAKGASLSPPGGQPEVSTQQTDGSIESQHKKPLDDQKEKKKDMKKNENYKTEREKSVVKEEAKKERKDGGDWKKDKHEHAKLEKKKDKQKWNIDEAKQWKEKDKLSRGDEGKSWKDREGKKEWKDKNGGKEKKEEKDLKKKQHEKVNEGKQWRGKEEKDWKVGRDHGEIHKVKEEWKKGKDGFKESGKDKWEKKDRKEKVEKKEWKKEGDWKSKKSKDSKEWKGKGEKKQWEENKNPGKERKVKDEKKQWKEKDWKNGKDDKEWKRKDESKQWENKEEKWKREGQKEKKDWKKDKSSSQMHKDELKLKNGHEEEHLWGDRKPPHSHRKTSLEHPDYWIQQKDRLQHNAKPSQHCDSLESCAGSEGLHPVPFPEFEAVLQTYLTKAEEVGVDEYKRTELKKLAAEFFKEGVFVHDQMSFQEFIEDVADILEDMVEGDEEGEEGDEEDEEDSAIEDEMEAFEKEVMKKFAVPGAGKKEELAKGEWRREGGQGRG
ncbi:pre-B-cell leukemia homeobox interacting protein 1b isoform X1 [Labrus bergylta]|uniref:pre-B-cell leukemia homeobox interacting protein 1b isoform X1 n=1 Tax=Labrus bergylta TaxID=56723 RepID=UPI00331339C7